MARPPKHGLDYFSFYTNMYEDEKIYELTDQYGPLGEAVYLRLLCMIYDKGYYIKCKDINSIASIISRSIGSQWGKRNKIAEVIRFLPACELLDQCCMAENVLTSKRIQESWYSAMTVMKRKIPDDKEYWLLENQ